MLTLLVALSLAAPPAADTRWSWAFEHTRSIRSVGLPDFVKTETDPALGKAVLDLVITESSGDAPKRLTVTVKTGPEALVGRTWAVESNYGEALLTELTKGARANTEVKLMRTPVAALLTVDPVVAAVASGAPCDEQTREQVAQATGRLVAQLATTRPGDVAIKEATAVCQGQGKGARYAVAIKTVIAFRDQQIEYPWKGTVAVAPGAWRADFDLQSTARIDVQTDKRVLHFDTKMGLKGRLTKQ